jgi:hypothetical protein
MTLEPVSDFMRLLVAAADRDPARRHQKEERSLHVQDQGLDPPFARDQDRAPEKENVIETTAGVERSPEAIQKEDLHDQDRGIDRGSAVDHVRTARTVPIARSDLARAQRLLLRIRETTPTRSFDSVSRRS